MSKKGLHSAYVWEKFWSQKSDIDQVYSTADRIHDQVKTLGNLKGKIIAEIGAGSGRDSLRLVENDATVIVMDYAMNSLKLIRNLSTQSDKKIWLVKGDAFYLPFKTNSLDITFHQGLLEHFKQPQGIIRENARALKTGGFAVADVPQRYHVYTIVKHILILLDKWFAGWEREFSIKELETLFRESGLKVKSSYGDWMRPSFAYRCFRETAKKFHIALPLYPGSFSIIKKFRQKMRGFFKQYRWSYYTFMDIGVIGVKSGTSE